MINTDINLTGSWFVSYDTEYFNYRAVLELLAKIHDLLTAANTEPSRVIVFLDTKFSTDRLLTFLHHSPGTIVLELKELTITDLPKHTPGNALPDLQLNFTGKLKDILTAYPVRRNDKRWETIQLTTASLFLGSTLTSAGYNVSTGKMILPATTVENEFLQKDMIGFTLFEDLFPETRELIDLLETHHYNGLLAAGGPMVSLNPLQTAWHFPRLNLLVRGEAELMLPHLLDAVKTNDMDKLWQYGGFLFQVPGTIVVSDFDTVNMPLDFSDFHFNLDFLEKTHLENGLEINLSRGCGRSCIFCSQVQGRKLRTLPLAVFESLLEDVAHLLEKHGVTNPHARSININDDDILQDMDYASTVFKIIRKQGFKLWGVQTSINSFFRDNAVIDTGALDMLADTSLYMDGNPLVWCGTDAFLEERGKKLGKRIPSETLIMKLMEEFEKRGIRNYHYWISSDYDSHWEEFAREFQLICRLFAAFTTFGLLAHAPFLVPYRTTPLYRLLARRESKGGTGRIKCKKMDGQLTPADRRFQLPLVERVETGYPHLNRLLDNEKLHGQAGFFDLLKAKDFVNASITLYNFLKLERLSNEAWADQLRETEQRVEEFIAGII
ncbi:MAG: hypothetical protein GY765_23850 [bacterium]|nr:hypothetical protein [bacterium]